MKEVARALVVLLALGGCARSPIPAPDSPEYEEAVSAFHTGVAAIQVGEDERAMRALTRLVELAPREPAAAANLAILALQQRRLDDAATWVDRALSGASENARIRILAALVERARGDLDSAVDHARRVPDESASVVRARFLLAQVLEQRAGPSDVSESGQVLEDLVALDSTNTFLALAWARHAARHRDGDALVAALDRLKMLSGTWPGPERDRLERVRGSIDRPADAGGELTLLAASLDAVPGYARERDAITLSEQRPDVVVTEFVLLPSPSAEPPEPDLDMRFVGQLIDSLPSPVVDVRPVWIGEGETRVALLGASDLWIAGDTGTVQRVPISVGDATAVAAFDFNHDFRIDLAVAGIGGLLLFRQDAGGRFSAVDARAIPSRTRTRALTGVWAADSDVDGDVDLVVAATGDAPFILRNRGDGTFEEQLRFDGLRDVRDFVWGDLDDDGVADAAFVDFGGRVHVFSNPRQDRPLFVRREAPPDLDGTNAIALGDLNADGRLELFALREDGALLHASHRGGDWQTQEIARWPGYTSDAVRARVLVADMDNNGVIDVASSAHETQLWLADGRRTLVAHETLPFAVTAAADLTGNGRIELLGTDTAGQPVRLSSRSTLDYYALTISPRATSEAGDRRINTFGVGGEAEVRAGLLYQKQPITSPIVHFGLGRNTGVTVARILWPNGTTQAEFDLLASQSGPIVAEQRLKGSCPWLFAFDGNTMQFVTDVAWRTALGLRINAYGASSVIHSEDRVRIRGDQLAARDGFYELSLTGELWESHFFDHVALMVVDHPADTEVFVDERFALPPPDPKLHVTDALSPVEQAFDHHGRDVTDLIASRDERYVDTFELGEFQGVTRNEHFLEVDLGPDAPVGDAPVRLVANGWLQPTDGSINFAIGQGSHTPPRGLRVEVADGEGGWTVLHADLGMPAGKTKTVLIDLTGAFRHDSPRRVRLYTNMEVYWDHVAWTLALPETETRVTRLAPHQAHLRYRGFSQVRRAGRKAPELPDYAVAATAPLWPDLEGHHTRFGDVLPLIQDVDDRYVIMNAGDEMLLRFAAQPEPEAGWVRDYVFITDAWVKDGDYNNGFSSTLMPLPYHGLEDYSRAPGRLHDDPAFRRNPQDWIDYHTRYVTPTAFRHALSRH